MNDAPLPRILFITDRAPGRDTGYGMRIANVISGLCAMGELHVCLIDSSVLGQGLPADAPYTSTVIRSAPPSRRLKLARAFRGLPAAVHYPSTRQLRNEVASAVGRREWDLVWCSRAPVHVLTRRSVKGPRVVDLDDLGDRLVRSEMQDRRALHGFWTTIFQNLVGRIDARRWKALQHRIAEDVEHVVVCSELDCMHLAVSNCAVVPNGYPSPAANICVAASPGPDAARRDGDASLLFVGPLTYEPNRLAVEWIAEKVLPLVRQSLPTVELVVVGDAEGLSPKLGRASNVTFEGRVPDVAPYYQRASVAVTPLHSGGGTRLKVIEALARRVPLVSTSFGCEGLGLVDGEELLVADEPSRFAAACSSILTDPTLRDRLVDAGFERYRTGLTSESSSEAVKELAAKSLVSSSGRHTSHEWVENAAPTRKWPKLQLAQPWRCRELLYFLALRDVKVRYKQAFLGAAWAVFQPLIGALAFTLLFNRVAEIQVPDDDSYFSFALVGFIVWTYFTSAVSSGTSSLLAHSDLITKVAFPRIAAPMATLLPGLVDLAIGAALAIVIALVWGGGLSLVGFLVGLPLGVVLLLATAAGPVLFFSAAIVNYRDAGVIVAFGLQIFLFVSPVAYPPDLVPAPWQTLQYLNPVAGCLALFRWALSGSAVPAPGDLLLSTASAIILLLVTLTYFRSRERQFVDVI